MSHKVLFHAALLVLALALVLTGCRRSTPIIDPEPEPPVTVEPVDPEPPDPADTAPSFERQLRDRAYSVGVGIAPFVLPEATGGNGPLTHSLDPALLPPGLNYHSEYRVIFGTPMAEGVYPITYVAEDSDDNHDPSDSAVLAFEISVGPGIPVSTVVAAVGAGAAEGVLRMAAPPEPSGGPTLQVAGNNFLVSGGVLFVDVLPDAQLDRLLVSVDMQSYYEIDLAAAMESAPYRLVGHVPPGLARNFSPLCLSLTGVGTDGAVGPPSCHPVLVEPVRTGDLEITVSWDTDADLDLHVVDPNGDEIYYWQEMVESGGEIDLESGTSCDDDGIVDGIRSEHVAWTGGTPPPGVYVLRVNYFSGCGHPETNYVVNWNLNGERQTFEGTFEGPGDEEIGRGVGEVIALIRIPGDAPPPSVTKNISADYRGSGDQVFVLNPDGEILDDSFFTLELGDASAEVYVIATNTAHYPMEPQVERIDLLEAAAKGLRVAAAEEYQPQPRSAPSEPAPDRPGVTEFNNEHPLTGDGTGKRSARLLQQAEAAATEGDTYTFLDLDFATLDAVAIPATVRRVVTDGVRSAVMWVADADWATACDTGHEVDGGAQPRASHTVMKECVTQQMVDTLAEQFLQPGSANDIHDWVSAIFGTPWGPHERANMIPPRLPGKFTSCCSTSMATALRHREKSVPTAFTLPRTTGCAIPTISSAEPPMNG